jgi:TetR/AcrR family transcriptional repressor of nem operon
MADHDDSPEGQQKDSLEGFLTNIPVSWYLLRVVQDRAAATRQKLIQGATELIRKKGYVATTLDHVCQHSAVTKGAFFHHFKTKEELAEACLVAWDSMAAAMEEGAPYQRMASGRAKAIGYMEFFIGVFDDPKILKSCLAGTTAQEVSDTNPALRDAANVCFQNAEKRFQALLDDACKTLRKPVDTASLAALWVATIQGSLILFKASQDPFVIRRNLKHLKQYIAGFLPRDRLRS